MKLLAMKAQVIKNYCNLLKSYLVNRNVDFTMNQNDINNIKNQMKVLAGATGFTIGRAAAMSWIGFNVGDAEYSLHLQTAFRIRTNEKILIANLDMFEATETLENIPSFDWDTFDWAIQGFNRYDEWAKQFKKESWRFFERNSNEHLIVTGQGIE